MTELEGVDYLSPAFSIHYFEDGSEDSVSGYLSINFFNKNTIFIDLFYREKTIEEEVRSLEISEKS